MTEQPGADDAPRFAEEVASVEESLEYGGEGAIPDPEPTLLDAAIDGIDYPDTAIVHEAKMRQDQLVKPPGSLGLLEELSIWAAGAQGQSPPKAFERVRLVIFAGDHGIAAAGVSNYPLGMTEQLVANIIDGGAAVNVLANANDVGVRVADISLDALTDPSVSEFKIMNSSGRIDVEDALTPEQAMAGLEAGIAIADEEIDAGADLLVIGDVGVGNTTPASTLISILTDTEPIKVVGQGSGIDDGGWIRKCAAIRDARRRGWPWRNELIPLLATCGGADLAAMTGFLLQAANRRTPVLLDGVVVSAAALAAQLACPRVVRWFQAGHLAADEPAHDIALRRLGLTPLLDLGMRLGEGTGALMAVPVLRAAVLTLAGMATFEEVDA